MSVTHEHEKAAIVGVGHVGSAMYQLIPDAVLYDPIRAIGCRGAVNRTQFAFICVPTPSASDGSCDTSAVEEVIAWLETPFIVIRSTVSVGFTQKMREKYNKRIVFQPEYYGETPNHPYADLRTRSWITLGGGYGGCRRFLPRRLFRGRYDPAVRFRVGGTGKIYDQRLSRGKSHLLQRDVRYCRPLRHFLRGGLAPLAGGWPHWGESYAGISRRPRIWRLLLPEGCPRPALHRAVRGAFFAPAGGNAAAECRITRKKKKSEFVGECEGHRAGHADRSEVTPPGRQFREPLLSIAESRGILAISAVKSGEKGVFASEKEPGV